LKIAVVGTGYVGLSNAILLAQHHQVVALDIAPDKVDQINRKQSPIEDADIEHYLQHKSLNLQATLDKHEAYPPQQVTPRGVENISNLIELGFDTLVVSPQPETWRKILREGFLKFTNWARATEQAIIGSAPQAAIRYKIPLILWGENPGLQLGDMKTVGRTGYDGNNLRFMNTVSGGNLQWLFDAGFTTQNLISFRYPTVKEFDAINIQIVYLGWFWNDWSLINNGMYSVANGLLIREESVIETGDLTRVSSLDEDWVTLNQMNEFFRYISTQYLFWPSHL
jgi:hypothetical protein